MIGTQTEIKFFWPLTEQVDLDLDFSQCSPHEYYLRAKGIAGREGPFATGMIYTSIIPSWTTSINIDTNNIVVTSEKVPPLYRRLLYKLLGINWKKK
jgi:hypothetical protein